MWFWVLLWVLLLLAGMAVLGLLCRRLYRQAKALTTELGVATDRLSQVSDALADLEQAAAEEVAERSAHGTVTREDAAGRRPRRERTGRSGAGRGR